jgi:hypothetical protein
MWRFLMIFIGNLLTTTVAAQAPFPDITSRPAALKGT